jgi:chaperone modulatory protein CbpM
MIGIEAVLAAVPEVSPARLADWIARGWLTPAGTAPDWRFAEIDIARIRLICDLRQMDLDDETLPLVLSLLDQLYDLRDLLRSLIGAVAAQPEEVRAAILAALRPEG